MNQKLRSILIGLAVFILLGVVVIYLTQGGAGITRTGFNQHSVHTELVIDASPEHVWTVLTDFERMPQWSNGFKGIEGEFADGSVSTIIYELFGSVNRIEHALIVKDGEYYGWSDPFMLGMTDDHRYIVEDLGNGQTRFIQSDSATGGLSWLIGGHMTRLQRDDYFRFNGELKMEAESRFQ